MSTPTPAAMRAAARILYTVLPGCSPSTVVWAAETLDSKTGLPELIEALRDVIRVADRDTPEFSRARVALAKATA